MHHATAPIKAPFSFLPEHTPMTDVSTVSNTAITIGGVIALLPIASVIYGAAKIVSAIDRIVVELREFKDSVNKKLDVHDITINAHSVKIGQLETQAEITHERLERWDKRP